VFSLDKVPLSPIEELPIVMAESLFEHQCRDQMAQHIRERTSIDPLWDSDQHGLLVQRLPSGELQVHVPTSISRDGPRYIVTPVDEDGSDLRMGTAFQIAKLKRPGATVTSRLLPRLPIHFLSKGTRPGLGVFATGAASTHAAAQMIPFGTEDDVSALSAADLLSEKADDPEYQKFKDLLSLNGLYELDERGVLIRIAPSDGCKQVVVPKSLRSKVIVVPKSLRSKVLYLEHYPTAVAHPGANRMFRTMRRSFSWQHMAEDVYETVRQCDACARNRISERRHTNFLQIFPANGPLESVAMDTLGPLRGQSMGAGFCSLSQIGTRM
jgi:Integrase zinc binding domain